MASRRQFHLEDSRNAILNDGFFVIQDDLLGANIQKMDDDPIPFASVPGLEFCKANVLDDPVSPISC